ncbi:MAG: DNA primase [Candidatus Doudnabacteria bacterium]|nr:DNA primase [Candidatus Doudnabacteria bacterium]
MADQVLQDIKDRIDVVDLIGSYIQVKRSGTNFKAVCPFHNEKSASLMVSPQKQIWHCFGCGEGGDIFGFVMRQENIDFKQALEILANKAGVKLPEYSGANKEDDALKQLITRINNFAAKFYNKQLVSETSGASALKYIKDRGLTDETIKDWEIGFSPDDFHTLEKELSKKGVEADALVKAGVSVRSDKGGIYDRFRNRVMFPIHNYFGDVVGFSARTMEADANTAKYINSPETLVYNKSKVLFGLYRGKEAIRQAGEAVVVEGQMDCIQAHQAGFKNVVATSGTALTSDQLRMLKRLADTVKFCFDADNAGMIATHRIGQLAIQLGIKLQIIVLPKGKDPDELIKSDKELWQKAVSEAVWFVDFYIEQGLKRYQFNTIEQKQYVSDFLAPILKLIPDSIQQSHYIRQVSQDYGINETDLQKTVGRVAPSAAPSMPEEKVSHAVDSSAPSTTLALEKQVLGGLLVVPEFVSAVQSELTETDYSDPEIVEIVKTIINGQKPDEATLSSAIAKEAQFMVESQLEYLDNNTTALVFELQKSFYMLKLHGIKYRQQQITQALKQAESQGLTDQVKTIGQEFATLSAKRMEYENRLSK